MTDPQEYRKDRAEPPAQGPGQDDDDAVGSLPPGSRTKPELGERGDVDRELPSEGDPAPDRMEPQPFGE
jgi:hypothetical protein